MGRSAMQWQDIAGFDAYLAGSIAARGWEGWDDVTAESEADSVGLSGEQHAAFLLGWQEELAEQERERTDKREQEYDEMAKGWEKGDPAAR